VKSKKKILIITDRFLNSGNGNFLRSYYLNKYLNKFFISEIILFNKSKRLQFNQFDLILLDLPYKEYDLSHIKEFNNIIVSLDHHIKFDVHLNISLFTKSSYAKKNLCDLKYTIIRDEIKKEKRKTIKNSIFMCIGSSDIKNQRHKVFNKLKKNFTKIYVSKIFNHKNKISKLNNDDFIKNMKECNLAITNGGTTMLELIYLNKMIISLPQTQLEKRFIKYVKKSYKIYSGLDKLDNNKIKKIINHKQKRGPIDGNGLKNIMQEIKNLLKDEKKNNTRY
jgi:spore coat polysaccharide biosynthesis predicted glycosyltransferase SpsG